MREVKNKEEINHVDLSGYFISPYSSLVSEASPDSKYLLLVFKKNLNKSDIYSGMLSAVQKEAAVDHRTQVIKKRSQAKPDAESKEDENRWETFDQILKR